MPVRVRTGKTAEWQVIRPGSEWKTIAGSADALEVDTLNYYIHISKS
ncbi:MAG TPA: hypothetical protein VGD92_10770 [Sphingobacteriaceae bacterium]